MKTDLKSMMAMLLVLLIQLQPLQVHAIVLDAEQSGHTAGLLLHSHEIEHEQDVNVADIHPHDDESLSDSQVHQSDCHPAHTIFPALNDYQPLGNTGQVRHLDEIPTFLSADISLDTPPPKQHAVRS
ncbi:MAG: hypothetical protein ACPGF7_15440 [Pontibacterium sp.]